jgi:hypothetical protein
MGHILTGKENLAIIGSDLTGGHPKTGRLAGPVGAQQAYYFSRMNFEVHAINDLSPTIIFSQPSHFQDGHYQPPEHFPPAAIVETASRAGFFTLVQR